MTNVGQRINRFDNLTDPTVAKFNELFPECPIKAEDNTPVTIGGLHTYYERYLMVGAKIVVHDMRPLREFSNADTAM